MSTLHLFSLVTEALTLVPVDRDRRPLSLVPERERVLIVAPAASYRLPAYLAAVNRLGFEPLVVSEGRYVLSPAVAAGLTVELRDSAYVLRRILRALRDGPRVRAAIATDDATLGLTARVCAALGLRHNRPEAVRAARRKDHARTVLARAKVPVPSFHVLNLDDELGPQLADIQFPCVVKPVALSASRGVIRADDAHALRAAVTRSAAITSEARDPEERRLLLVERFIEGGEIAIEAMLSAGRLTPIAIFDKPEPLDGPFFEESYYVTPSRLPAALQKSALAVVDDACRALGLREGPVHAELRVRGEKVWVLEVAARTIGGDCARLLELQSGESLESLVLSHALGVPVKRKESGVEAAGVLMLSTPSAGTLRRVEGVLEARALPGVDDVVIALREGYELVPLPEGGAYLGFVFATGREPQKVEATLRRANALLQVIVAPAWRLEPQ